MRIDIRLHLLFNPHLHGPEFPLLETPYSAGKFWQRAPFCRGFSACRFRLSRRAGRRVFASGVSGAARAAGAPVVISRRGGHVSVLIQGLSGRDFLTTITGAFFLRS